jgi:hypothetical protein
MKEKAIKIEKEKQISLEIFIFNSGSLNSCYMNNKDCKNGR